ncbi:MULTISPECIES: hypothetical protein [Halomonas]|uniref:Protein NO VEIN C-terminal domain-containing protein n=1 Tax=Halomonas halophila TaxID=29573 RepID=A0ABQ0U0X8_9GAMM|nr:MULTISPECIES: hypothetical protein [Halomonas]MDR5888638.1 hypothetical protein [Halomonas salina]WJY07819.1 hypothetical protein QWG60_02675 [Halomonas halophila]GEK72000.1 hypothetical protein HHA04nite_05440 [Halomonas halophila]
MSKPHQRVGSVSNAHVGRDFENVALKVFARFGLDLEKNFKVSVGLNGISKLHAFDLGSEEQKILVECKSHKWTAPNDNVPSAKLTVWNEAMYYFLVAPPGFRKILFVLRDMSERRQETLAEYYIRNYRHLIPGDVEIWEFDESNGEVIERSFNQ